MKNFVLIVYLCFSFFVATAQTDVAEKEAAYTKTITERAQKIVAKIDTKNTRHANRVTAIVANQYRELNNIHTAKNSQLKLIKAQADLSKEAAASQVKMVEDGAKARLDSLHKKYIAALAKELSPSKVDAVKDGMTYDVLHVTYNGYNQMILNLTEPQKKQIMEWLTEARELAMDAESSDKKHATFGKYKGRINNYLSAAGYDLNKEGKEWEKRRNASKTTTSN